MKAVLLFLFLLFSCYKTSGQNIFTAFQSEEKKANQFFEDRSYWSAYEIFSKIATTTNNKSASLKAAQCLKALYRLSEAKEYYEKAMIDGSFLCLQDHLAYAESLMSSKKYGEAKIEFEEIALKYKKDSLVGKKISALSLLDQFFEDSLSYKLNPLPINSLESDFSPALYKQGLLFLSSRPAASLIKNVDAATNSSFFEFYYSKKEGNTFSVPRKAAVVNNIYQNGPVTFFNEGNSIIFNKNDNEKIPDGISGKTLKHLMLYTADKDSSGQYTRHIKPLPINNAAYSVGQCSYSEQNHTLYFASDMPGGYGGTDLYKSQYINSNWTIPTNLGPYINTFANEMFPFIYGGKVLCFSSNGHAGLGGLDNFYTILDTGNTHIQNVGYPINTESDDFNLIIGEKGTVGYLCSNRTGNDDIYEFSLNKILLRGMVLDKMGDKKMSDVVIKIIQEGIKIDEFKSDETGSYKFTLKPGKTYFLTVLKEGYKENKITLITPISTSSVVNITKNIILERRNKSFVKGIVKDTSGLPIPDCAIKIINSFRKDQYENTDKAGIFKCEVDSDVENLFIADKDRLWGSKTLKPESRNKGSLVLNIELEVYSVRTFNISGILKSEKTHLAMEGFEVIVENFLTGEKQELCTGVDGKFNFKAFSHITYDLIIHFGKNRTQLKSFKPKQDYNFEIFWEDK